MQNIISELYNKHIPLKIFKKLKRFDDWELMFDFEQEMLLNILEIPPDKLIGLHARKELDNYFGKICLNQLVNPKSTFNKKYETKITKLPIIDYENVLQ